MKTFYIGLLSVALLGCWTTLARGLPVEWSGNYSSQSGWGPQSYQGGSFRFNTAIGENLRGVAVVDGVESLVNRGNRADSFRQLQLRQAYLELGPDRGDATKLRLGTLNIQYSPYLASFSPWQGLGVANVGLGAGRWHSFYAWSESQPVWGSQLGWLSSENAELRLNLVGSGPELNFSLEGIGLPYQPLVVNWAIVFGNRGLGPVQLDSAYRANDWVTLRAGWRSFPTLDRFNPPFRDQRVDDLGDPINPVDRYQGQTGTSAGATFHWGGINTSLDLSRYQQSLSSGPTVLEQVAGPNQTVRLGVTKAWHFDWAALNSGYTRQYHYATDYVSVSDGIQTGVRFDTALLQGLELGAQYRITRQNAGAEPLRQALGIVSYQRSGVYTKWSYDFYSGQTATETYFQVKF